MCRDGEDLVNHLLLHCPVAKEMWDLLLAIFGLQWVMLYLFKDLLFCWGGVRVRKDLKRVWRIAPLCLAWSLWGERNRRTFDGVDRSIPILKDRFLNLFYFWVDFHFSMYVDDCDFCGEFKALIFVVSLGAYMHIS
uniref:Reverse transcriptase zinc-binding domain-containing protein n=1 Tax=Davidia involucrata TaxID=16924 RepID=A0A5B7BJ83_DAVIN